MQLKCHHQLYNHIGIKLPFNSFSMSYFVRLHDKKSFHTPALKDNLSTIRTEFQIHTS